MPMNMARLRSDWVETTDIQIVRGNFRPWFRRRSKGRRALKTVPHVAGVYAMKNSLYT